MVRLKSVKAQLILYLLCLALAVAVKDKDFPFLLSLLIAVVSAVVIDSLILYLKSKIFQITESSLISGLIVGYVLSSNEVWWKFVFAASLTILSKHLIRFRGRHIFNPAAFGLFLTLVLLGVSTQWKGAYVWYVLVPFGVYFITKLKKLELLLGYILTSLILFGIQAIMQKTPISNIFGYLNYFYIFIMLIEPKTTPINTLGKLIFGIGVAILIFILTEWGFRFDVELCALLVFNLAVPLLNKLPEYKK